MSFFQHLYIDIIFITDFKIIYYCVVVLISESYAEIIATWQIIDTIMRIFGLILFVKL